MTQIISAVVEQVLEGRYGPFAIAVSDQLYGQITFSLRPGIWKEAEYPKKDSAVSVTIIGRSMNHWLVGMACLERKAAKEQIGIL